MRKLSHFILQILRKGYSKIFKKTSEILTDLEGQEAANKIRELIEIGKPLMIGRFGSTELHCLQAYSGSKEKGWKKYIQYIKDIRSAYFLEDKIIKKAYTLSGIFPPTKDTVSKFSELMINDINELDVLGRWMDYENHYIKNKKNLIKIPLADIEPYYNEMPWTAALKNKIVLVIHPFVDTIQKQYKNRALLFENPDILPKFNLKTIKSVQSLSAGQDLPYKDWFEALESMKNKIDEVEFDVAIIGCGAYGFPLAAHIKRRGKQAIHMGGATQILFGIKGKRWENHKIIGQLFNEHWTRPSNQETPIMSKSVEDGCYW